MCGVAGIVGLGNPDERSFRVSRMTTTLAHRGPDGQGLHHFESGSLGHRRLAIIDPTLGKQPLSNEDGTVWLTYNGEIYNYRELRQQLVSRGHRFKTQGDSEVVVHAWEEWGPDCVKKFRGMFAFGLVDTKKKQLMLARDQLGIKPLCYRVHSESVAFASEIPALLQASDERPSIDAQAIDYFLRYRYIPAPESGYVGIRKLPPATYQIYDFEGKLLEESEYWKLEFAPGSQRSNEELLEEFEATLMDSVQAHLVSDVPFGAFLSGGIDSTLVVACMAKLLGKQVRAYTIDFEEDRYSERKFAEEAAKRLGIELRHEVVRPNVVDALERLFKNYGEPFADTSAIPTWWVSELARQEVPMVLSGDGADEAFAGYGRYARWMNDSLWSDVVSFPKYPKRLWNRLSESVRQRFCNLRANRWQEHFVGMMDRDMRRRLWNDGNRSRVETPCPAFAKSDHEARHYDSLSYAQYVDIKTYLPGDILTKVDIASMQHGLEVRTPFTDIRMFEFAAQLPEHSRFERATAVGKGSTGDGQLKAIPKTSLQRTFPSEFVNRKKMGFAIPEAGWMQRGTPVRACFDDLLASNNSPIYSYFERSTIEQMTIDFDGRGRHATELWSLFALSFWMNSEGTTGSILESNSESGRKAA